MAYSPSINAGLIEPYESVINDHVALWKFVAENDTEKSQLLWNSVLQKERNFLSVIFSVAFVWHNEDDSRIGFSHNNSEPNRIKFSVWL